MKYDIVKKRSIVKIEIKWFNTVWIQLLDFPLTLHSTFLPITSIILAITKLINILMNLFTILILFYQYLFIVFNTTFQWILIFLTKYWRIVLFPINIEQSRLFTTSQQISKITFKCQTFTTDKFIVGNTHHLFLPANNMVVLW